MLAPGRQERDDGLLLESRNERLDLLRRRLLLLGIGMPPLLRALESPLPLGEQIREDARPGPVGHPKAAGEAPRLLLDRAGGSRMDWPEEAAVQRRPEPIKRVPRRGR